MSKIEGSSAHSDGITNKNNFEDNVTKKDLVDGEILMEKIDNKKENVDDRKRKLEIPQHIKANLLSVE